VYVVTATILLLFLAFGADIVLCVCLLVQLFVLHVRFHNKYNAIEPSTCGGDVALRQITLTTCY